MTTAQQRRRDALRNVDDLQGLAARRRIVDAYRAAATEDRDRVSVTWICERAGVGRSTFYTHFSAVSDLALSAVADVFGDVSAADVTRRRAARATGRHEGREIARDGLERAVAALEESRVMLVYAAKLGSPELVRAQLTAQFAEFTRHTVDAEYPEAPDAQRALITEYVSAGTTHAVMRWLDDPAGVDRAALVDLLVDQLPARLIS